MTGNLVLIQPAYERCTMAEADAGKNELAQSRYKSNTKH